MKKVSLWLGVGALILGCSSKPSLNDVPVTYQATDNPAAEIAAVEKDLGESRRAGVGALSPTWFARATQSLAKAHRANEKGESLDDIFKPLGNARAELAKAKQVAQVSQKELADVVSARERALSARQAASGAGAVNLNDLNKDFADTEKHFMDLGEAIEKDDLADANKGKGDVIKEYNVLYARSLRKENLDSARRVIEEAKKQGAKKYAPLSLELAERTLERTDKFIESNPTAQDDIRKKSDETLFYANRALHLTQEGRILADKEPEQLTLWVEENLSGLVKDVSTHDVRDRSFAEQVKVARAALGNMKTQVGAAEAEKAGLTQKTAELQTESEALRSKVEASKGAVAMDQAMGKVRKLFSPSEAAVLREGDNVVLRLKAVQFPVGKATLAENNFALFSKVKKAVDILGDVNITVEGHTDSSGTAQVNQALSQKRAEAVKAYLVSNEVVAEDAVEAVGKGFDEPIASNKTKAGRATNRRIDLVIKPGEGEAEEPTPAE